MPGVSGTTTGPDQPCSGSVVEAMIWPSGSAPMLVTMTWRTPSWCRMLGAKVPEDGWLPSGRGRAEGRS